VKKFFKYAATEMKSPVIYISSIIVGVLITLLNARFSPYSFIIPFLVQLITRVAIAVKNEKMQLLLQLPKEKSDPAFITNHKMEVLLSLGKTKDLFDKNNVKRLSDLLEKDDIETIKNTPENKCTGETIQIAQAYSPLMKKYYKVSVKHVTDEKGVKTGYCLFWFQDITVEKQSEKRHNELLKLSNYYLNNIRKVTRETSSGDRLADFALENGFQSVFIATTDETNTKLTGKVYKRVEDKLINSERISLNLESEAPILLSRVQKEVFAFSRDDYENFEDKFPFNKSVKAFVGMRIDNFITYHEIDLYVIAFNYYRELSLHEKRFFKTYVNFYKIISSLTSLARENDEQFIQKIMGLAAAAEYSDEITGDHILRVNHYSEFIARQLGMDDEFCRNISQIAAIHDIGKVAIPELIKLERRYTQDERDRMKMHTVYGAQIIRTMMEYSSREDERLEMAYNIALHHHQIYAGNGYPGIIHDGKLVSPDSKNYKDYLELESLTGEMIPLEARIVSLADRYDAIRSPRQYKPAFSHEKTMNILKRDDRTGITGKEWFSEKVWNIFLENHKTFDKIFNNED